jgi:glycosyltransferase involved in cell wall biosynthesis
MMDPAEKNILHIVKGIDIGGNSGGAENFGIRLVQSLNKWDMNVTICAFLHYGTAVEQQWLRQLQNEGIEVFYACSSKKINIFEARKNIKNWIRDQHVQIVHSHYQVGTITCLSLKLLNGCNYLLRTAHANLEFGKGIYGSMSRLIFRDFLYPLLVNYEIGVSRSITESLNQQIIRRLIHKPAHWIPNAIPDIIESEYNDDPLSTYLSGTSEIPWLVTSMGILLSGKNLDILIKAISEVIKTISNAKLVIVGDGPEYNYLVNVSKELGISNSCWFLGQQENIHYILEKSNVFVLPSSSEGLSTVLLEAMQNKVPVIASDIAGNRELIQDEISGWLVPVGDVAALSTAIIRAYQQPLKMKNMAEAAFTQISTYSLSSVCDQYVNAYLTLTQPKFRK